MKAVLRNTIKNHTVDVNFIEKIAGVGNQVLITTKTGEQYTGHLLTFEN